MDDLILALDFGGTKLTAAALRAAEASATAPSWQAHRRTASPANGSAQTDIHLMLELAWEVLGGQRPFAIGVSFGGPASFAHGTVIRSDHVPGWDDVPLQARLEAEFGAPVRIDNDANAAALGEHRYGAGCGFDDLFYVTVSTGVGGGWILGGRPWRGHNEMAGEIGHTVVLPDGPLCLCGKRGCVERLASGPYMAADAQQRLDTDPNAGEILRATVQGAPLNGAHVAAAAAAGDLLAAEILQRGAWALGVGLGNAANLMNPQRFVLGGGVAKAGTAWWATVRRVAHATALADMVFDVVPAALGDDAPLWGAAALGAEAAG